MSPDSSPVDSSEFRSPKNLAIALSIEAAEVLEHYRWTGDEQSMSLGTGDRRSIEEELADVMICLVRLADRLGTRRKISLNAERYPADKARGNTRKYTDL